jgi:Mrp family chromosome partitioning ATPase
MKDGNLTPNESLMDAAVALPPPELDGELRRIMEQMNLELPNEPSRTIVVTGAQRNDGVSTIACWLSAALATSNLGDILYLDADLSSPSNNSDATACAKGLLELVCASDRREAIYQETAIPNLLTMRAWTSQKAGAQITEQQVAQAFAALKKRFAYIVIDAQAPLASPLTITLARHSGGTLIVVAANETDRELAVRTCALLRRSGARIIGAIINKGCVR